MSKKTNVKKFICLVVIFCAFLSLCACNKDEQITSVSDLAGKRIAVQSGSIFESMLKDNEITKNSKFVYTSSTVNSIQMLTSGKVDAYVSDNINAQYMVNHNSGLTILQSDLSSSSFGFAFQKGDKRVEEFNSVISSMISDGTIDAIAQKWLGNDSSQKYVQQQKWEGKKGTLVCMVSPTYEPVCYTDSTGDIVGFDLDVLVEAARILDYKIDFISMPFDNLFLELKNGNTDIIASGISITDVRKQNADFTIPYYDSSVVFVVKNGDEVEHSKTLRESFYKCFIEEDRWLDLLNGLMVTVSSTTLTLIFGIVLGFVFCILAYNSKAVTYILSKFTSFHSLIPFPTSLYIGYYIIFSNARIDAFWVAVAVLTLDLGYTVYGILMGGISSTPEGEIDAAISMGYTKNQILFKLLFPRIMYGFLTSMSGCSKGLVKTTALIGMISVADISAVMDNIKAATLEPFLPLVFIAICYAVLSILYSKLFLFIRDCLHLQQKSKDEINERILRGKI